jgi:peptide/nickel transport system permease protein
MWSFTLRRLLYSIPVYLGILLFVMAALRVNDPVGAYLGKNASQEQIDLKRRSMGLDRPFPVQYAEFLGRVVRLDFGSPDRPYYSWQYEGQNVGTKLREAIVPTLALTVPELLLTTVVSLVVGLVSAFHRGRMLDRVLMFSVVLGMSISAVVYIVLGQYFGAYWPKARLGIDFFQTGGYEPGLAAWPRFCLLPVLIGVVIGMGYDSRFYRAVMVEECTRDYITTALAKGATAQKIMFVHMLKNAMIPIVTRVMITMPFLISGSFLLEYHFRIPGMGKMLLDAITNKDFPIIQVFTAILAALFILTNILTDLLYALVDPRVRLS